MVLLLAGFILHPAIAATEDDPLIMGVFPRRNLTITIKMFSPMARYLSKKLGHQVKLVTSRNFPDFWQEVKDRRYDIVHYNQYHYIKSHKEFGYQVILKNEEFGKSTISGAIIVRRDSDIRSLQDLKGKTIIFGGSRQAMVSYIMTTHLLRKAGLKAGHYQEIFALNPPNAFIATYFRKADAGGVGNIASKLPIVSNKIDTSKMQFIAISKPLVHLPWAVKSTMKPSLRTKIQSLLADLYKTREGKRILKQAGLTNLIVATDQQYNPHRWISYRVMGIKY